MSGTGTFPAEPRAVIRELRSAALTQVVQVVDCQIGLSPWARGGAITALRRDRHHGGLHVPIDQDAGDLLLVAPCPLAVLEPRINAARRTIGEIDDRDQARASP